MSRELLIIRPQPGASQTAERARTLGLVPIVAPLFAFRPIAWQPPDPASFDAMMLTSANAVRHGGDALAAYVDLPCYAVGEATAKAARAAGFENVHTGPADAAALLDLMAANGVTTALHLAGLDRLELAHPALRVHAVAIYSADALDGLSAAAEAALARGALVLIHSPRAAALLSTLVGRLRARTRIAAISADAAEAAGPGWAAVSIAHRPRDEALLELAAKLCQNGGE
ncbi:uroporphyrinogen-III synthase [Sphingosinicella sp. CPCC 101087]|uniref:uroporphyrinogen-III synthase n=1 Tax=Sphingosinicella sp. CPCC 101087 TaxID=2497754 RepID=UPI00101DE1FB|nr:uroporphyrinogen-III synthase [Sphingosinicella sp. CPCC 101087]